MFVSPKKNRIRLGPAALAVVAVLTTLLLDRAYGQLSQQPEKPTFDVASIREWGPGQGPTGTFFAGLQLSAGRLHAQCINLQARVFNAYQLTGSEPVEGMPRWGRAGCGFPDSRGAFAVEATMPADTSVARSRQMMQTLLGDRFRLAVHWETRQLPVYALRIVPGKSKLKPSDPDKDPPFGSSGCPADDRSCHIGFYGSKTMAVLAGLLSHTLERPVIDETGATGFFSFGVLKWAGDDSNGLSLPSLVTLLRQDFGLDLKAERGSVPVLVIDHVEKPTAN